MEYNNDDCCADSQGKKRAYVLTINNYNDEHVKKLKDEKYKYLIIGDEIAPTTGTPHLQIYIHYKNPITWKSLKTKFPSAYIYNAKGTAEQNQKYCSKTKTLFEDGEMPNQGKRTDIEVCKDIVKNTNSMRQVVSHATSIQGVRMAEIWLKYHEPPRNFKPHVTWIYGPSGTGKSKLAHEMAPEDCYYTMDTGKWFEGYDGHENIIIDDIRKDFMKYSFFLKFLDRYAYRFENKGGSRQFKAKRIIITSIYHPEQLWNTREDLYQLTRRIDEIIAFYGPDRKPKNFTYDDEEIISTL